MIENMDKVGRTMGKLRAALPFPARIPPALMATLRGRSAGAEIAAEGMVKDVFYMGEEGGITCNVTFDEEEHSEVFLVSITQLAFDRRLPFAHDIEAYQKHRIKRIRRDHAREQLGASHWP
jgi:hypothetical protein